MHICMITREFPPDLGGISYYVYYLSKKLQERGHEITVITRGSTRKTTREVVDGINVVRVTFFPIYPFHIWIHGAFVNQALKSIERNLTLIHLHSPVTPPIKTSLPKLTTVHTPSKTDARYHEILDFYSLAEKMQSKIFYPHIEARLFNLSKMVTSVSFSVAKELREYGLGPGDVTVIGNGVNEQIFVPIRKKDLTKKYVLYTGGLRARKGLFDFIDCAKYVSETNLNIRFLICGTGPFLPRLLDKVLKMGLQRYVLFLGHISREKLVMTYQNATIHVVPSHYEGLPTVLLEAMACGLPVVATDVGANNEVISSGKNGFLVPPKSPKIMAEAIISLLNDSSMRRKIGEEARKTIETKYTWDKITDKVLICYDNILKK